MNNTFTRLIGTAPIVGGLTLFVGMLFSYIIESDIEETIWARILPLAALLLSIGAVGLWSLSGSSLAGRLGSALALAGGLIMGLGLGLMGWFDNENGWPIMFIGMMVIPVGLLVFGLAAWRTRLLPRWNRLPLLIALIVAVGMVWEAVEDLRDIPWEQQSDLGFVLWIVAVGLGWPLLGLVLLRGRDSAVGKLGLA